MRYRYNNTGQNGTIVNTASGVLVMPLCGTTAGADAPIEGECMMKVGGSTRKRWYGMAILIVFAAAMLAASSTPDKLLRIPALAIMLLAAAAMLASSKTSTMTTDGCTWRSVIPRGMLRDVTFRIANENTTNVLDGMRFNRSKSIGGKAKQCVLVCFIVIAITLALFPSTASADTVITAVYPGFDSTNIGAFQLNGNASLSGDRLQLTPSNGTKYGTAWWKNRISLANNRSFSTYFTFQISEPGNGGADGLVFVIQTQSSGAGMPGGGMGYDGIRPSVGIEFDTWNNGVDPDDNHVGVDHDGSVVSLKTATPPGSLENETWYVWVDYNGADRGLEVRMNTSSTRPELATLNHIMDLEAEFGPDVYVGFTAATANSWAKHEICALYFDNDYIPEGITPDTVVYTSAPTTVELTAAPTLILADGVTTSTISATSKDVSGNPIPGQTIQFTTSLGTVNPTSAVTNVTGVATTDLSGTSEGEATVRGLVEGGAYGETQVTFGYRCTCGDICANTSGWWRSGGEFHASTKPLQAAVDAAVSGDVVCVIAGSYSENVNIGTPYLMLEGADVVTVTAASSSDHVFSVTANYVNISGFTVTGATGTDKAGIYLDDAENCNISYNTASNNRNGICVWNTSNNNLIANNIANSNDGYGIHLSSSSSNLIYNNYFNNTNNAYDNGNNQWNITKIVGMNIIGGSWLGGNCWSDYAGSDTDGDGLGDTMLPYDGSISTGGDYRPLCAVAAEVKLTAGDGAVFDWFGSSVSISGDYAIVGAYFDDDDGGSDSGSAYIFKRDGTSWGEQAKITASDGAALDWFGHSVSISGDYAIVGACQDDDSGSVSGSAYIFKRDGTSWSEQAKITASDGAALDWFGSSVSISGDYVIVGARGDDDGGNDSGSAYIFKRDGTSWSEQAKIAASDGAEQDIFGISASISGDYAIVGAYGDDDGGNTSGSAYIFKRDGTSWSEQAKITASDGAADDHFGISVSISGDYAIVSAYLDDDGGSASGSAYLFNWNGTSWNEQAKITASDGAADDHFGHSVSISGDYVIVGARDDNDRGIDSGSAYIFKRDGTSWYMRAKITASDGAANDFFGYSAAISGDYAIVGACGDDDRGSYSGSAYVYDIRTIPNIISSAPESPVNDSYGTWTKFNVSVDQIVNVTWYLDGTAQTPVNASVTEASYTFHADDIREHNISAVVENANGTDMQTWVWDVTEETTPPASITVLTYYGWLNCTTIDWNNSGLTLVIVADDNPGEIQKVREAGVDVYFYITLGSTYNSTSDKSNWEQGITDSIDRHSYVNGFFWDEVNPDYYGENNKTDFNQRLTTINSYVHSKGQKTIANGVRYYADHCGSDYYMWESFMSSFTWYPDSIDYYYVDFFNTTGSNNDPYQWVNNIDKWEYLKNSYVLNKTLAHCYGNTSDDDKSNYDYIAARVLGVKGFSYVDSNNFASTSVHLAEGMRWDLGTQFDYAVDESNETLSGRFANGTVEDDVGQTVSTGNAVYSVYNETIAPASITGLDNTTYEQTYINWTWTDPADDDFETVMIYLDGTFEMNVSKGDTHYNATELDPDTEYIISTQTADTSGNVNATWVNGTAMTEPDPDSAGAAELKIIADDGASDDWFGRSVSTSGDYAIVGAYHDDDSGSNSGSAYIFKRDGTSWSEQAKITASDGTTSDYFGYSVSISGDYAIVGAYGDDDSGSASGSAYIFKRDGTSWIEQAKLAASDGATGDLFSYSVSISGDYAIVGAYGDDDRGSASGSAYIFKRDGTSWSEQAKIAAGDGAADDWFGYSASISGDYAIVGAYHDDDRGSNSGSAYIFERDGTSWSEQEKIAASDGAELDNFGISVSISGDYAIVGACHDDDRGSSSGSAYIFERDGTSWSEQEKIAAIDGAASDVFGYSVAISGDYAIVGAYGDDDSGSSSGSAYIFERDGTSWSEPEKIAASDGAELDNFGISVSISGDYAIVGAYGDADSGSASGSAYIYDILNQPSIISSAPRSPVTNTQYTWTKFNVSVDRIVDVTWYLDGTAQMPVNASVTEASCTFYADNIREHNVSVVAKNANGADMQIWIWNVTGEPTLPAITINTPTTAHPSYIAGGEQFQVNFTYTEPDPANYTVIVGNSTTIVNSITRTSVAGGTDVTANEIFYLDPTTADGWYNVSVEMYDSSSNCNITYQNYSVLKGIVNVLIDSTTICIDPLCRATANITLNNVRNYGAGIIHLYFDETFVRVNSTGAGESDTVIPNRIEAGHWILVASNSGRISGNVVFATVTFEPVNLTAQGRQCTDLELVVETLYDRNFSKLAAITSNGSICIGDSDAPILTSSIIASPQTILNDNGRARVSGTNITRITANVTDDKGVDNVAINLTPIRGPGHDAMAMTLIDGTEKAGIWSIDTNADHDPGVNLSHNLTVVATDYSGNSETANATLTVLRRGDIDRNNVIDMRDYNAIAMYIVGLNPAPDEFVAGVVAADRFDGVDLADALYILMHIYGGYPAP